MREIFGMRGFLLLSLMLSLATSRAAEPDFDAALKARRDRDMERLERGLAGESVFYLVQCINRKYREDFRTIHLFHTLDEKQPALAKRCFHHISDALLDGNRAETALFRKHAGDLVSYLQRRIDMEARSHAMMDQTKANAARSLMQSRECMKLEDLATKLARVAEEGGDAMTADVLRRTAPNIHLILGWEKPDSMQRSILKLFAPR